ncbi:MAG: hypothetical protein ABL892_00555 [Thiobacillaceae bacterium]
MVARLGKGGWFLSEGKVYPLGQADLNEQEFPEKILADYERLTLRHNVAPD